VIRPGPGKKSAVAKLVYKPFGLFFSVLGGMVAAAVFKRVWRAVGHESDAPHATAQNKGWGEVITAGAAQGAIFGGVKAVIDRAGATGFARLTGVWPGSD
jgi:hypothetical protein